ncbi:AarF/ABC1/UbiB kinase family protein [Halodesulfurarchaeum sp. HSR-GB]|nr:AarF/ABC1/UbiB kinase family protein [Halodesulfurarchaeum sp. HSR-GB]MDR5655763.1 AarF/ABC1/UbiB kinase family protein [Halodesulfurarchaeum sp. HSR-GB]
MALRSYWRFVLVAWNFMPLLLRWLRDRRRYVLFGPSRSITSEERRDRAQQLLDSLLTLGPTFIKFGQILSTRPDVLPPEYIEVLTQLQDKVPPAPWPEAKAVIEADIGPIEEAFDDFDTDPISGASLGQVYRATVDGEEVAVKVRRPGIEELVEADLTAIKWALPLLLYFVDDARAFSLENFADEFAVTIREEMDYGRERDMLVEIRQYYEDDPKIRMPPVVDTHSSDRVLTMEYIPGTKITDISELDAQGIDRTEIAERLTRTYLEMITEHGVYHADPHPGNLAVQSDGTIVFYDFGMSGRVDQFLQEKIIEFYIAVANREVDEILDVLVEMGTLSPDADRQTMAEVMELAIQDARGEEIETWRVQEILNRVEGTIYEFPFRLPENLALVMRVATVVEGVCVTLDPDFDFIDVASDFLTERGYREESIQKVLSDTGDDLAAAARSSLKIPPKLDRALNRVERESLVVQAEVRDDEGVIDQLAGRIVLGLLVAAGIPTTALLYVESAFPAVWGAVGLTAVAGLWLVRSFTRRKGIRTAPGVADQYFDERQRHRESQESGED